MVTCFPLLYRLRAKERYLIWAENNPDSIVTTAAFQIPTFKDLPGTQF